VRTIVKDRRQTQPACDGVFSSSALIWPAEPETVTYEDTIVSETCTVQDFSLYI